MDGRAGYSHSVSCPYIGDHRASDGTGSHSMSLAHCGSATTLDSFHHSAVKGSKRAGTHIRFSVSTIDAASHSSAF